MSEWLQHETTPILIAQTHEGAAATHATTAEPATPAESGGEEHPSAWLFYGFSLAALVLIVILVVIGTRRLKIVPRGLQNMLELIFEGLYGLPEQVMGARGRQYAPFVSTFFIYIVVMNLLGLIPFLKPATASLSITLGMAIVAFVGVQYYGFKAHGIKYLAHFLGPVPLMAPLIFPLEIVSELIRPVSLSVRLYGNIFGEEQVVSALAHLFPAAPLVILPLQVLTVFLQGFVFTLLVTVYIALATEKHSAEHAEAEEAHAH